MALDVGTLVAHLKLEDGQFTSKLGQAEAAIRKTEDSAKAATTAVDGMGTSGKSAGNAVSDGASKASNDLDKAAQSAKTAAADMEKAGASGRKAGSDTAEGAGRASAGMDKTSQSAKGAATELDRAGASGKRAGADTAAGADQAATGFGRASGAANDAAGASERMGESGRQAGQKTAQGTEQATRSTNTLAGAMEKARGIAAGLGLVLGARQAVGFFTDAINSAREAEAYTLRVKNTFTDAEGAVTEWAQTTAHGLRMSEDAAKNAALSFSTFGIVLGESGQDLADYSTGLAELAADLAAYGDYDLATVVNDMTSALSGQAVPMRKYGVLLDEATLRQIAFEEGITETNRELTQNEKVLAITAGLYKELDYAVGASEMSAGTFGDSMRELRVNFENVRSEIGQKFLPIANTFVQLLSGPGLSALSVFGDALGIVGTALETVSGVFLGLPGPIQAAIAAIVGARLASRALGTEIGTKLVAKLAAGRAAMSTFALEGVANTWIAMERLRGSFITAGGGVRGFAASASTAASGGIAAFERGVGNVVNMLGGPYMLAIGLAAGAIGQWIGEQKRARERTEELENSAKQLARAVADSGVEIDGVNPKLSEMAKNAADAAIENIKLANSGKSISEVFEQIGVSSDKAALGLAGNKRAAEETIDILEQLAAGEYRGSDGELFALEASEGEKMLKEYVTMYEAARVELELTQRAAEQTQEALTTFDIDLDPSGVTAISEAMEDFADTTKSAVDRIDALTTALDQIYADQFTEDAAMYQYGEAIDGLAKSFGELDHAAINADGSLNLMDSTARSVDDDITKFASSMNQMAGTMLMADAPLSEVTAKLAEQREAFIEQGVAAGISREEMELVADYAKLIPEDIVSMISTVGAEPAAEALDILGDKIDSIDGDKIITTEVLSDEAIADLEALGLKVEKTPDGKRMEITADGTQAELIFELMKSYVNNDNDKNMKIYVDGEEYAKSALDELIELVNTDNEKDIEVDSNAEDVIALLEALNITTTSLEPGKVTITDNADAIRRKIEELLDGKQTYGQHTVYVSERFMSGGTPGSGTPRASVGQHYANADGSIRARADGALDTAQIRSGTGDGIMQHTGFGPVRWAEAETSWEAFIPGALSKRRRSTEILRETARRMGYGVIPLDAIRSMADGGVVESITSIASEVAPALQVTSSHRPGDPGHHGTGNAVDLSNGTSNTDEMLAFANYMADNYKGELAELIYHDPRFSGRQIKNGQFVDDSFYAGAGDHTNHVHVAAMQPLGQPAMGEDAAVMDALHSDDERTRNAAIIIDEGRKRGMSDKAIRTALATALVESDLRTLANPNDPDSLNYEHSGLGYDHDSSGVFQQRANGAWGTAADRMDTRSAAGMFYDELAKQDLDSMDEGTAAQAVQRSAVPGAYAGRVDEADELLRTIGAQTGTSSTNSGSSGRGEPVYVTNWPSGFGGGGGSVARTSALPADMAPIEDVIEDADPEGEAQQIDLANIPKAGAEAAGKGLLSDLGIGQGGVLGALIDHAPELAGIATAAAGQPEAAGFVAGGVQVIFNVTDIDEALREYGDHQARESLGFKGSGR